MTTELAQATRQRLAADLHRPRYHFQPPSNWMNDPNGLIQSKGQYHLFYQYNPHGPLWGDIHWGHAVSADLIHWRDLSVALAPMPGSSDEMGCFSGCVVDNGGLPTIIYTGVRGEHHQIQTQNLATSPDDLLTWEKYAGNPVLAAVPDEAGQTSDFRDPFVWKEDDGWYMVLGSRIEGGGGAVFLYRSTNLTDWEYLHPLLIDDRRLGAGIWECPNFFPLGDQWVLIVSGHSGTDTDTVIYFVGSYENHEFKPTSRGVLDYGRLYAPLTMLDGQQRRILFGWLREDRSEGDQRKAGWSGVQSIPRVLTLDDQQRLIMTPVSELAQIRGQRYHLDAMDLSGELPLDIRGLALDISAEFALESYGHCGIALACSPDGTERIEIVYEAARRKLVVRRIAPESTHTREIPHDLAAGEALTLRILLDGSVVELIANGRTSLTSRIYPSQAESDRVHLFGSKARLRSLDLWEMPSIWS